jgi:hypothetical protein
MFAGGSMPKHRTKGTRPGLAKCGWSFRIERCFRSNQKVGRSVATDLGERNPEPPTGPVCPTGQKSVNSPVETVELVPEEPKDH